MSNDICGIYQILNTKNNKRYIGLSIHCGYRFLQHKRELNKNRHSNEHLQAAWNKYGAAAFEFSVIEAAPRTQLPEREKYWISHYNSFLDGYNNSLGGDGTVDVEFPSQRNKKISDALANRKRPEISGDNAYNAARVVCLNTGTSYVSMRDAADKLTINYGGILRSCRFGCTVGDGLVFMREDEYRNLTTKEIEAIVQNAQFCRQQKRKPRRIVCLNTGDLFDSANAVCAAYNIKSDSCVYNCCKGLTKSSGVDENGVPLVWTYEDIYQRMSSDEIEFALAQSLELTSHRRFVYCDELDRTYSSIKDASKCIPVAYTTFVRYLNTEGKYTYNDTEGNTLTFRLVS